MRYRRTWYMMFTIILLLSVSISVYAITTLSVPFYKQEKSNWCWAACARMVGKYYVPSSTKTQTQIVVEVKGSALNEAGTLGEIAQATSYVTNYGLTGDISFSTMSFNVVKSYINGNDPIQALVRGGGSGHYYVIYGYNVSSGTNYLYLINPGDGHGKYVSYSDFKAGNWTETRPWKYSVSYY